MNTQTTATKRSDAFNSTRIISGVYRAHLLLRLLRYPRLSVPREFFNIRPRKLRGGHTIQDETIAPNLFIRS